MWHYGHLNGCDINVDFPKASYAHWVSGLSLLNHGPYITYKTRQRSQNSAETGTRQSMHFYWLHPSHLNRCRMGSKGRCHHGFEIILHFQPSRGSTATYLHIPPPKVLNLSHFKCPVCLQKGQTSLMNGNLSTQELIESALWTHSLPLTALQFLAPCQYENTLQFSSHLFWVEGWGYIQVLARSLVAANFGGLVHAHLILWFFYALPPPTLSVGCLLALD